MNLFWNIVGRISCFCGFHHMHDLNDKAIIVNKSSDLKVDGEYCCRCHKIVVKRILFKGETVENPKVKKL